MRKPLPHVWCPLEDEFERYEVEKQGARVHKWEIKQSTDGRFAACQASEAPYSDDGSVLTIFDLSRGLGIGAWVPESGWANFSEFAADGAVSLGYRRLGVFRYAPTGEFLDCEAWQDAQLSKGDYGSTLAMIERLIKEAGGKPSHDLATKLITGTRKPAFGESGYIVVT